MINMQADCNSSITYIYDRLIANIYYAFIRRWLLIIDNNHFLYSIFSAITYIVIIDIIIVIIVIID